MKGLVLVLFAMLFGCSASQQPEKQSTPQCLSLCSNQFAACTEEYPGDASACLPARHDCERTCQGQKAMERMEGGQGDIVMPPERPTIIRPDAGTTDAPDSGQAPD